MCVFLCAAAVIEEVAVKPPYHAKGYNGAYVDDVPFIVDQFNKGVHISIIAAKVMCPYGHGSADQGTIRHILRREGWWPPAIKIKPTPNRPIKRVIAFQNWTPEKQYQEIEAEYCK